MAECNESANLIRWRQGDESPGGWCSAGVLGMVTLSPSRKGLDSYNTYHEPVPEIEGAKSTGAMVHVRCIDEVFRDII